MSERESGHGEALRSFVKAVVEDKTGGVVETMTEESAPDGRLQFSVTVQMPVKMDFVPITLSVAGKDGDQ